MACDSDIRVEHVNVELDEIELDRPLVLSKGIIAHVGRARASVLVRTRTGAIGTGRASTLLSVGWAWPEGARRFEEKVASCRAACADLARELGAGGPFKDPIEHGHMLSIAGNRLAARLEAPPLVAPLLFGVFDSAVHDAWGKANRSSCYEMYDAEHLNRDLGAYLSARFRGYYPASLLRREPLRDLPVQTVIGLDDDTGPEPRTPSVKVKVDGRQMERSVERLCAVHEELLSLDEPRICVDANESFPSAMDVLTFIEALRRRSPRTLARITYWEQPLSRGAPHASLARAGVRLVLDEGLPDAFSREATELTTGRALKTFRGQTQCLLHYCAARVARDYLTIQDLTNIDVALLQAAHLSSQLHLDSHDFECNSMQYVPSANVELHARFPHLRDGHFLRLPQAGFEGLSEL